MSTDAARAQGLVTPMANGEVSAEEREGLRQEALLSAQILGRRMERIVAALNTGKIVSRDDTVHLGTIAAGLEKDLVRLFKRP